MGDFLTYESFLSSFISTFYAAFGNWAYRDEMSCHFTW